MKLQLQESQESSLCFLGIKNDTPRAPDLATRQAASPIWIKVFETLADIKGFPASASGLGRKNHKGSQLSPTAPVNKTNSGLQTKAANVGGS